MSVSKSLRKILFGLIFAMAVAACAVDDSDSPGASPPAATADDGTPTTTPDEGTPSPSLRTSPSPSPTAPRETPSDEDLLKVGDRGPAVKEVQTLLKALGYELTVDGVFGPNTNEAVVSFEMETGLPGDGAVGAEERRALEAAVNDRDQKGGEEEKSGRETAKQSLLQPGDEGRQVRLVQRELAKLGYWVGPRDGVYGTLTEQAVLALQGVEGLNRDGILGSTTRVAMKKASPPEPHLAIGDHIEIDESRGVILLVRNGKTKWIFHTSTGTEESYQHEGCIYSVPPVTRPHSLLRSANRTRESNASIARVPGDSDAAQTAGPK